jgi:hypothetical protein
LRLVLEAPRQSHRRRTLAILMKGARGAVDSGVPDLASNGFGQDAHRPLVAFLDRAEQHHYWVAERIEELDTPLLVCEPVLAEAMHLLARFSRAHDALFGLVENDALMIAFHIDEQSPPCASCIRNIRCHSPMRVLCGWLRSMSGTSY